MEKYQYIWRADAEDVWRIAEIEIFNYRLNFYPIFRDDEYYFGELRTDKIADSILRGNILQNIYVYDDTAVKGFVWVQDGEVKKLFVEPVLQGQHIGEELLMYAVDVHNAELLWALEKNTRAIKFYARHGFLPTGEKKPEEGTTEYLVKLRRVQ
ncbi:MAG: GNAT family N-acetyltransferase [Oscillospiraceae bacterium]